MRRRQGFSIDSDDLWPRDEAHRYRIYARRGDDLEVMATAAEPGGIGEAIVRLDLDEREIGRNLTDRGALGILDVVERRWLVLPWQRKEQTDGITA